MKKAIKGILLLIRCLPVAAIGLVEVYSVGAVFDSGGCDIQDSVFDYLGCNGFLIFMAVLAPLWAVLMPAGILFFGLAMPIASAKLLWSVLNEKEQERGYSFCLGGGLAVASYLYISRLLPFTVELIVDLWSHVPKMFNWYGSLIF
jgi:hypothetical protein